MDATFHLRGAYGPSMSQMFAEQYSTDAGWRRLPLVRTTSGSVGVSSTKRATSDGPTSCNMPISLPSQHTLPFLHLSGPPYPLQSFSTVLPSCKPWQSLILPSPWKPNIDSSAVGCNKPCSRAVPWQVPSVALSTTYSVLLPHFCAGNQQLVTDQRYLRQGASQQYMLGGQKNIHSPKYILAPLAGQGTSQQYMLGGQKKIYTLQNTFLRPWMGRAPPNNTCWVAKIHSGA